MEEGDDGGDEAETEGGLMVHRGAEVIMHGKGTFPRDVVCYNVPQDSDRFLYMYLSMYVLSKGVFL